MRKILYLLVLMSISFSGVAQEVSQRKAIDSKKYCYAADDEYSKGAIMYQAGFEMKCVRSEKRDGLKWVRTFGEVQKVELASEGTEKGRTD